MNEIITPTRRGFITGLGSLLITAPAIVRAASLMPVRNISIEDGTFIQTYNGREIPLFTSFEGFVPEDEYHARMIAAVRREFLPGVIMQIPDHK